MTDKEIIRTSKFLSYLVHTLHANLWCLLATTSHKECVLKAVNLWGDTDTTDCVAGGLAGVHYGPRAIPENWRRAMARYEDVDLQFGRFAEIVSSLQ